MRIWFAIAMLIFTGPACTQDRAVESAERDAFAATRILSDDCLASPRTSCVFLLSVNSVERIDDSFLSAWTLSPIAHLQADIGDTAAARRTAAKALAAAQRIEATSLRAPTLRRIVDLQATMGNIASALDTAQSIDDPAQPPIEWTCVDPAKSEKPMFESQPPPQIQWPTTG